MVGDTGEVRLLGGSCLLVLPVPVVGVGVEGGLVCWVGGCAGILLGPERTSTAGCPCVWGCGGGLGFLVGSRRALVHLTASCGVGGVLGCGLVVC
jgi:hypothetical protein